MRSMENKKDLTEVGLSDLVRLISEIFQRYKRIYLFLFLLVGIGSVGIVAKSMLNPQYRAEMLIGSEALSLPNLEIIVDAINLEVEHSKAMNKFNQKPVVYRDVKELKFGKFSIQAADVNDKSLKAYKLSFMFSEPKDSLDFDMILELVLEDIKEKGNVNVSISKDKLEIEKNIADVVHSIEKANETELALRRGIAEYNHNFGVIGLSEFYQDLNDMMAKKNEYEKKLFFYEKDNLVYKLSNLYFDHAGLSKIELLAYSLFLFLFLSLVFTIYKLIFD
jgi:hypothetical protein